ncbi:pirin family protein [Pseudoalteromonas sp. Cnat2-41]|uniref:pirin family protein n=1 Tax=unclassified Pseudoalteromonas TaxID=194690 RepID=UPI001EF96FFA|nr:MULTISPECIES: pirin family protein [unclassified Pseudoalteromonas]MCF2863730.1 pirin family protein [Pseudoalteromonas sp. CNAT2-18]MCG7559520.1 pirin family protein [Pseudoalteromonas sp. CNAT2-18.1]
MAKILEATQHDIGGLTVKRILPHLEKKMVGPFIFFDHMGPTTFAPGQGVNVRPHPHIGLSTLTYLFTGSLLHRDSLGNHVEVSPGDVNWMTAGRGIVHSERESIEVRASHHDINGLQCWVALPPTLCEIAPSFTHINKAALPQRIVDGVTMRLIAGDAFAMSSPVKTYSPLFYLDIIATAHSRIAHPNPLQEAAIYVIFGAVEVGEITATAHQFVLLQEGDTELKCQSDCRFILLGGNAFNKAPYLHWNFVAHSRERIEQAKSDWQQRLFADIPGDDNEFIPL